MNIAERYRSARHASNLKSDPRTRSSPSDVLGAVGMASQEVPLALMLWSVVVQGSSAQKMKLVDVLERDTRSYMFRERLLGNARHTTIEVLAWVMHGTCPACHGTGHEVIPMTITRSEAPCGSCNGVGRRALPQGFAHAWLADRVDRLINLAAGVSKMKLA